MPLRPLAPLSFEAAWQFEVDARPDLRRDSRDKFLFALGYHEALARMVEEGGISKATLNRMADELNGYLKAQGAAFTGGGAA